MFLFHPIFLLSTIVMTWFAFGLTFSLLPAGSFYLSTAKSDDQYRTTLSHSLKVFCGNMESEYFIPRFVPFYNESSHCILIPKDTGKKMVARHEGNDYVIESLDFKFPIYNDDAEPMIKFQLSLEAMQVEKHEKEERPIQLTRHGKKTKLAKKSKDGKTLPVAKQVKLIKAKTENVKISKPQSNQLYAYQDIILDLVGDSKNNTPILTLREPPEIFYFLPLLSTNFVARAKDSKHMILDFKNNPFEYLVEIAHASQQKILLTRALYFSGVTMATIGYGDIIPTTNLTRWLALLEAAIGVLLFSSLASSLFARFYVHYRDKNPTL